MRNRGVKTKSKHKCPMFKETSNKQADFIYPYLGAWPRSGVTTTWKGERMGEASECNIAPVTRRATSKANLQSTGNGKLQMSYGNRRALNSVVFHSRETRAK